MKSAPPHPGDRNTADGPAITRAGVLSVALPLRARRASIQSTSRSPISITGFVFALLAALCLPLGSHAAEIRLRDGSVEAIGLSPGARESATLTVRVDGDTALPNLAGKVEKSGDALRFVPAFPLVAGMTYRATLIPENGTSHESVIRIPVRNRPSSTVVTAVYPSAETVPANLLKFYVHFSAPIRIGGNYQHVHLLDDAGKPVDLPFLELDEELWDPDQRRLTIFLDPARIKRGLKPHEEHGRALKAGESYTLVVGNGITDARRAPLAMEFRKSFRVTAADFKQPDIKSWKITPPPAGSRLPLRVDFGEPLDRSLLLRLVTLKNTKGKARTAENESRWEFTPNIPWKEGSYRIRVGTLLEDLAGNSLRRPFEVLPGDLFLENLKEFEEIRFTIGLPEAKG